MRLIDADKFLDDERKRCCGEPVVGTCTMDNIDLSTALGNVQAVEAEPVRCGKWLVPDGTTGSFWRCSSCNERNMYRKFNYCPNCGTKME